MLTAISRYGARVTPDTEQTIAALHGRGQLVEGPHIEHFEHRFAQRLGVPHAISASYGRMAFSYLLEAMAFPAGSEIIIPALTFWVVPEIARVAGLVPVFADVDPETFTLDPDAFERAITPRTRAVVPTHLYGLPCDMERILEIARRHGIAVIEDCAHALGASWRGKPVGTLGDAAFFSFQLLKPLNAYGGGMAVTANDKLAARIRAFAEHEPWPLERDVRRRLRLGQVQRIAIRPRVFTCSLFPVLWTSSYLGVNPDVYLWEPIRSLEPLPAPYHERFSNVQAAIGLAALTHLDAWTTQTIANATVMSEALTGAPLRTPRVPDGATHVYYQYAIYPESTEAVPAAGSEDTGRRDAIVKHCIRRGVDVETLHVDVCTRLPLFGTRQTPARGAERAAAAIQLPVHAAMRAADLQRVAGVVREAVALTAGS